MPYLPSLHGAVAPGSQAQGRRECVKCSTRGWNAGAGAGCSALRQACEQPGRGFHDRCTLSEISQQPLECWVGGLSLNEGTSKSSEGRLSTLESGCKKAKGRIPVNSDGCRIQRSSPNPGGSTGGGAGGNDEQP